MMMNLFTVFDPMVLFSVGFNWISIFFFFCFSCSFWLIYYKFNYFFVMFFSILLGELKQSLIFKGGAYSLFFLSTLFMYIFVFNFLGLFPYVYSVSSQMSFCFSLSLIIWFCIIFHGWFNYFISMMAHLVPEGTPGVLMPFMVIIELISNLVRPITLSVRLMANMIAGHLLLSLLGSCLCDFNFFFFIIIVLQTLLSVLELAVSLIQAYVFSFLMSLYVGESLVH